MKTLKKIAIISLITGLGFVGISFGMGLQNYNIGNIYSHYKYEDKILEVEDKIEELSVELKAQEIKVVQGNSEKTIITYRNPISSKKELIVKADSSKIDIREKGGEFQFFSIVQQPNYKIQIELAKDTNLSKLNIGIDTGHAEIVNVNSNGGRINLHVGDLNVRNSKLNNMELSVSTGSIKLEETKIQNSKAKVNLGDIKGDVRPSGEVSLDVDTGSVNLNSIIDNCSLDLKTGLGDIKYNGQSMNGEYVNTKENAETTLKISTDLGDINLKTE